jgi:type II secretory pathway component PulM
MRKLDPKEKKIVTIGGIALAILLYLAVFIFPTLDNISKYENKLKNSKTDFKTLENLVLEHRAHQSNATQKHEGTLLSYVEQKAADLKMQDQIGYLRPFGDKGEGAELKIDSISGENLIKFMYELQQGKIKIGQLQMSDFEGDGVWTAKLFLEE